MKLDPNDFETDEEYKAALFEKSYRGQIEHDLTEVAEKWRGKGMPGLAAILMLVNEFYSREMEGYLLGVLSSIYNLMKRLMGETNRGTADPERTTGKKPSAPGRQRDANVLDCPLSRKRATGTVRIRKRR